MPDVVDARLFEQCTKVYEAMLAASNIDAAGKRIYRGYTTYLLEQAGYSISNYTPIMRRLRTMVCIQQKVRGGRGTPSEWLLIKPPTRAAFVRGGQRWVTQNERISSLEARVAAIEELLEGERAS
jgi:hypothetical protein